jgi:hypothetical protein
MKKSPSLILGWTLTGLCLLSFFMPWVRFAPEATGSHVLSLANTLAAGDEDLVSSYLGMKRAEVRAMFRAPADGLSGYQLVALASGNAPRTGLAATLMEITGMGDHLRWVVVLPILAFTTALALTPARPSPRLLAGLALALAAAYAAVRWKLNSIYTDRLLQHIDLNLGFWVCVYTTGLLALIAALRAVLPDRVRF